MLKIDNFDYFVKMFKTRTFFSKKPSNHCDPNSHWPPRNANGLMFKIN